ncbi:MAG: hypothetical protein QM426_08480 [Euryarchaeota archaeon]|nr:hypothetical protein [Euryarchaeota archaeon]
MGVGNKKPVHAVKYAANNNCHICFFALQNYSAWILSMAFIYLLKPLCLKEYPQNKRI